MNRLSDTLSWVGLFRLMSMIIILLVYFPTIHKKPRGDPQPAAYLENITKTCLIQGASCQLFHKFPSKKKHLILPKPGLPSHHLLIIRGISPFAHVNRDLAWLATDVQLKKWLCLLVLTFCRSCHFKKMVRKPHSSTFNRKIVRGPLHFVAELSLGWDQPNYM